MRRNFKYSLFVALICICLFAIPCNAEAAAAPAAVTVTNVYAQTYNHVVIKWKPVSQATHYIVYYRRTPNNKWSRLKLLSSKETSYTHVSSRNYPLVIGRTYEYYVRAYNIRTRLFSGAPEKSKGTVYIRPDKVKLKSLKLNKDNYPVLTWEKTASAGGYVVLRRTSGAWIRIADVSSTQNSFTDRYYEPGKTNYYSVRAYRGTENRVYGTYNSQGLSLKLKKDTKNTKTLRVLFIGNSHTLRNNLPAYFAYIARRYGYDCTYKMIAHNGWRLSRHVTTSIVRTSILKGKYDYVVLQDRVVDFREDSFLSSIRTLNTWARQAKSKVVLYMPWTLKDNEAGQSALTASYKKGAQKIGAIFAPVGTYWWAYLKDHSDAVFYDTDDRHATTEGTNYAARIIWKYIYADLN